MDLYEFHQRRQAEERLIGQLRSAVNYVEYTNSEQGLDKISALVEEYRELIQQYISKQQSAGHASIKSL